jgi:hypothetical protein
METRFVKVLEGAYTNEITRINYISRLNTLVKKLGTETLLEILEAPDTFYPRIRGLYESITTRKNVLTAVLVLFREDAELKKDKYEETRAKWKRLFDDLARHQDAKVKRSEPEPKQIEKYTSYEEIEAKYEDIKRRGGHTTLKESQTFVLLSILVHLRPKRADLGAVHIFKDNDPNRTDINYIVLRSRGASFLAMNLYKTSKHYRKVEEDLPEGLVRDIVHSLKRWPRAFLFVKEDGDSMSNNTYSKFVSHTFEELFGRATGVSLLRHIYISEKLDFDDMTLEEQEEEARLMLHTSGLQRRYKWPKKTICPKLCSDYMADKDKKADKKAKTGKQTRKSPKQPPPKRKTRRSRQEEA